MNQNATSRTTRTTVRVLCVCVCVCVFITAVPIYKAVREGGGGGNGGHVLRETTSRSLCELVCPSRTNERGGEGYCVKEGGGEEGDRERERAGEVRLHYSLGYCG
jgi:hypothetical protein